MVPPYDVVLTVAWLAVLAAAVVRYRWFGMRRRPLVLVGSLSAIGLSYALVNLTDGTPFAVGGGTPLDAAVLLGSVALLVAGLALWVQYFRLRRTDGP